MRRRSESGVVAGVFGATCLTAALALASCSADTSTPDASAASAPSTTKPAVVPSTTLVAPTTTMAPGVVLFDFADPGSAVGWSTVNDTVMGGVSASSAQWEDGALVFSGTVSLDNNGGFTSVMSPPTPGLGGAFVGAGASSADASAPSAIVVTARGDGRSYVLQLRAGAGGRQQWTQTFTPPVDGGEVALALSGFAATDFMLDPVAPAPVDVAVLDSMAIYLVDGQEGPFRLDVTSISAR